MKGNLSIKYVLPAVWQSNANLWNITFLPLCCAGKRRETFKPYDTLPALPLVKDRGLEADEVVKEGTGAMLFIRT